jgi:hypothetical protein
VVGGALVLLSPSLLGKGDVKVKLTKK